MPKLACQHFKDTNERVWIQIFNISPIIFPRMPDIAPTVTSWYGRDNDLNKVFFCIFESWPAMFTRNKIKTQYKYDEKSEIKEVGLSEFHNAFYFLI